MSNIFLIVPAGKQLDLILEKARGHNILELINFGKSEPYKDFIKKEHVIETVKDAFNNFKTPLIVKRLRKGNEPRRYLIIKFNNDVIIKKPQGSDHHKTNLNDLINNWYANK